MLNLFLTYELSSAEIWLAITPSIPATTVIHYYMHELPLKHLLSRQLQLLYTVFPITNFVAKKNAHI